MPTVSSLTCLCFLCQQPTTSPEPHPVLGAPVCAQCLRQHTYDHANSRVVGVPDGLPLFSVEFEVCSCCSHLEAEQALVLLKHDFLRTFDPTVSDEYKSPRYQSLAPFLEALPTMERLSGLVDRCCGTHIHIDCPRKLAVRMHSALLFSPLLQYFSEHEAEAERFWGRRSSDPINLGTRYNTVEFRVPRFRSAQQYLAVVQFCRQVGSVINESLMLPPAELSSKVLHLGEDLVSLYQQAVQKAS